MGDIPNEIIVTHIFPKLAAKSLLILKCVCKSWRKYIADEKFIRLHLNNSVASNYNQLLILSSTTQCSLLSLPLNSSNPPTELPLPTSHDSNQNVVSCCDGLVCVNDNGGGVPICVINPSTGFYKQVPWLRMPRRTSSVNLGFGFDHVNKDYKVVRLIYHYASRGFLGEMCRLIGVYSLKENVWRIVEWAVPFDCVRDGENGALLNKHLIHWIVWCFEVKKCKIRCFDICQEKWVDQVPMPHHLNNIIINNNIFQEKRQGVVDLVVFDGYLCIISKMGHQSDDLNVGIDVWIMKEYGVRDSWVRLFRIWDEMVATSLRMAPLIYSNQRNKVLLTLEYKTHNNKLCWYNLKDKSLEIAAVFNGIQHHFWATNTIGSLVTIPGAHQFNVGKPNNKLDHVAPC